MLAVPVILLVIVAFWVTVTEVLDVWSEVMLFPEPAPFSETVVAEPEGFWHWQLLSIVEVFALFWTEVLVLELPVWTVVDPFVLSEAVFDPVLLVVVTLFEICAWLDWVTVT